MSIKQWNYVHIDSKEAIVWATKSYEYDSTCSTSLDSISWARFSGIRYDSRRAQAELVKDQIVWEVTKCRNAQGSKSLTRRGSLSNWQSERMRLIFIGCTLLKKLRNVCRDLRQHIHQLTVYYAIGLCRAGACMYTLGYFHPRARPIRLSTRQRQKASKRWKKPPISDESTISKCSMSRERLPNNTIVCQSRIVVSELAIQTPFKKTLHSCKDVFDAKRPIVPFEPSRLARDVQGADHHGASGNGHRPWWLANHSDRWREEPDQRAIIGIVYWWRNEGVWGQKNVWGE